MTMTSQVSFSGNAEIDGILYGTKWAESNLTFSFAPPAGTGATTFSGLQQTAVRQVLTSVAALTNVSLVEVAETASSQGVLRFGEASSQTTASAYMPAENSLGGDAWFNPRDYETPAKGTYAYATLLHETGHALGLDHGQDGTCVLPDNHDSLEYSVMTYRSYPGSGLNGYTVCEGNYPRSYMLSDVAALQYMYGADYAVNSGATTYRWSPSTGELTVDGVTSAKSSTNTIFETIWDGGGVDTYDLSAYSCALKIDLRPGAWTSTGTGQLANLGDGHLARGNIANAYLYQGNSASLIENARGGSANDQIVGNDAANKLAGRSGNDKVNGLGGRDVLIGGGGSDSFVFNTALGASNVDQIKDFAHDVDRLKLDDKIFTAVGSKLDTNEFHLGTQAHGTSDRVVYDRSSGSVWYDADGSNDAHSAVLVACLTSKPVLDTGDFAIV